MELSEIQQLSAWLKASGMRSLELNRPGERLRLKASINDQLRVANRGSASSSTPPPKASLREIAQTQSAGIFLAAHPMHNAPLVNTGDAVRKDDVVGLLKTGLIYAPVTAPIDGVVSKIVAADAEMLGFGSAVLELDPICAK